MRSSLAALALVALAAGCTWTDVRPEPPKYEQPEPFVARPKASEELPPSPLDDEGEDELGDEAQASKLVAALAGPRFRLGEVIGATPDVAGVLFSTLEEPIEACPGRTGVLNVRITSKDGRTAVQVLPGSNVTPETENCVLQALSVFEPTVGPTPSGSPSDQVREFSSVLTVQW